MIFLYLKGYYLGVSSDLIRNGFFRLPFIFFRQKEKTLLNRGITVNRHA